MSWGLMVVRARGSVARRLKSNNPRSLGRSGHQGRKTDNRSAKFHVVRGRARGSRWNGLL